MKKSLCVIGADLGGTHLRWALAQPPGRLSPLKKILIGESRSEAQIIQCFVQALGPLIREKKAYGLRIKLAVGIPGIVTHDGVVSASPHYPVWKNFRIQERLTQALGIVVCVDNDANLMALGESHYGLGKNMDDFILVTLGTGLGGALVLNRRVYRGPLGFAGEFGHQIVDVRDGELCGCGARGCWETRVSASALVRRVGADINKKLLPKSYLNLETSLWSREIFSQARRGNPRALSLCQEMGVYLGVGIASLINITGIATVILNGGFSALLSVVQKEVKATIRQRLYRETARQLQLKLSRLGDRAGILGAILKAT